MRLRMKFWPQGIMSAISAQPARKTSGIARQFFSWQGLGAAVLGVLLAKWVWVLFAPASAAMPAASWEASGAAERLFGTASVADTSALATLGDIKLIGVFAHPTKGFAVMQVDEKQIGVGLGDEVKPGVKLVETDANYVMLERAGVRQRVDLTGAIAAGGTGPAPSYVAPVPTPPAPTYTPPAPDNSNSTILSLPGSSHTGHPLSPDALPGTVSSAQIDVLQQKLDSMNNLPPQQREAMKRKLEMMRGTH